MQYKEITCAKCKCKFITAKKPEPLLCWDCDPEFMREIQEIQASIAKKRQSVDKLSPQYYERWAD